MAFKIHTPGLYRMRNGRTVRITERARNDSYRWQDEKGETWAEDGRSVHPSMDSDRDILGTCCDGSGLVTAEDDYSSWPCGCNVGMA